MTGDHCIHDQGGVHFARHNIIKCNEFLIKIASQKNALTTHDVFFKYDEAMEKLIKDPMTTFSPRLFKQFESHQLTADWSQSELPLLSSQHATSLTARVPSTRPQNSNGPRSSSRCGKRTKDQQLVQPIHHYQTQGLFFRCSTMLKSSMITQRPNFCLELLS
ncbi:unnamed protein product [Ambrosiozyma monospora]|uniref:Unnamed protein product n=1 Tax=Ambrosiozyma monospora TaxID=43982 RepID=A0A9W6Z6R1_AMBMO|nr:unnamed protein product [Ambrosiozyma monospora]